MWERRACWPLSWPRSDAAKDLTWEIKESKAVISQPCTAHHGKGEVSIVAHHRQHQYVANGEVDDVKDCLQDVELHSEGNTIMLVLQ